MGVATARWYTVCGRGLFVGTFPIWGQAGAAHLTGILALAPSTDHVIFDEGQLGGVWKQRLILPLTGLLIHHRDGHLLQRVGPVQGSYGQGQTENQGLSEMGSLCPSPTSPAQLQRVEGDAGTEEGPWLAGVCLW